MADLFRQSGAGNNYNQTSGEFTTAARPTLAALAAAWQQYLSVNPNNPDPSSRRTWCEIYGPSNNALNQPTNALAAEQIVINNKANPAFSDYESLAFLASCAQHPRGRPRRRQGGRPRAERPARAAAHRAEGDQGQPEPAQLRHADAEHRAVDLLAAVQRVQRDGDPATATKKTG